MRAFFFSCLVLALASSATADPRPTPRDPTPSQQQTSPPAKATRDDKSGIPPRKERPQFVLFCFDVTPVWGKTIEQNNIHKLLTRARAARPDDYKGEEPTVTVFINTGYLQLRPRWWPRKGSEAREKGKEYWKPYRARADREETKVLHYARSIPWILERAERLKKFEEMGVEIASHGVMHLNGSTWDLKEWRREFEEHQRVLDLLGLPEPRGYRAPFLATPTKGFATLKDPLFRVLKERGFRYDSSRHYTKGPRWPRKIEGTEIWEVPIETTFVNGKRVLMFTDYGTDDSNLHYEISLKEFRRRYYGERAPIIFGGHGEHMRSNLRLMKKICYLPDVRCGTFSELVEYMDEHPELSGYKGPLSKGPKRFR